MNHGECTAWRCVQYADKKMAPEVLFIFARCVTGNLLEKNTNENLSHYFRSIAALPTDDTYVHNVILRLMNQTTIKP